MPLTPHDSPLTIYVFKELTMGQGVPQTTFTAGELSPSLYGRIDLAKYFTGLKTCRNFIVRQYGGVSNRTGTRFIAEVKNSATKVRLIPFSFSTTQTYVLEFGHQYMRVIMNGGQVVYPVGNPKAGQIFEISTIYLADDLPRLKFTQSADVMTICHPNYPTQQLSRTDHCAWSFAPFANVSGPFQDINVDDQKTVYASGTSGSGVTITASSDIFEANMVGMMMYLEQSADAVTPKWEVSKAVTLNYVIRAGEYYYQAMTAATTGTVKPDHTEGTECDGNPGVAWKYLNSGSGIVQITGFTSTKVVTVKVLKTLPQNLVTVTVPKTITNVTPSRLDSEVVISIFAHGFPDGSSINIAGVTGTVCNGTWVIKVIDSNSFSLTGCTDNEPWGGGGTASKTTTGVPSYKWAFESWGGDNLYPAVTAYYQQRQCFGGSGAFPQTVWLSRTAGYLDFGVETVILDDDAIKFTVASREVNEVRHLIELTALVALTSSGEWIIQGSSDGVLTPSSVNVKRQGYNGCSHVPPIVVNSVILYIQEKGSQVRSLGYSFQQDAYIGNDLTVLSSHLFEGHTILEWAFQQIPYSCIWAVRDDGVLLGFTYMQDQEVAGWHWHDSVNGYFESVCSISESDEDAVFFVVRRVINGVTKRYIEKLETRYFADIKDAFFVDAGLTYDGRNSSATAMTISGGVKWDQTESLSLTASTTAGLNGGAGFQAGNVGDMISFTYNGIVYKLTITAISNTSITSVTPNQAIPAAYRNTPFTDWAMEFNVFAGLEHLEGQTVSILADGNVHSQRVVTVGAVTLDYHASVVHVGLPIIAEVGTLSLSMPGQNILDKKKLINKVSLICEASRGIMVGPDADHLREHKDTSRALGTGVAIPVQTGMFVVMVPSTWGKNGTVVVRQSDPLPLTVLALIPEVAVGGA